MTKDAFIYALSRVEAPPRRRLWLYGGPAVAADHIYNPLMSKNGKNIFSEIDSLDDSYDAIFVDAPKQKEEAEGLIALSLKKSRGLVMAAAANNAGGNRLAAMMEAYGVPVESLSKSKCRIVWTTEAAKADLHLIEKNISALTPQHVMIDGEKWWSVAGLFGWDKIDAGSKLLLQHLPDNLAGIVADFGCGYGYLSTLLARKYPAIEKIDAYDLDARAIACCARNGGKKINALWQDIRTLPSKPLYNAIVMNPPFHSGKNEDVELGRIFLQKAWESLASGGRLFLVANKHLPYEKIIPQLTISFEGPGFKIMTGQAP